MVHGCLNKCTGFFADVPMYRCTDVAHVKIFAISWIFAFIANDVGYAAKESKNSFHLVMCAKMLLFLLKYGFHLVPFLIWKVGPRP